jgi:hypothetical protein
MTRPTKIYFAAMKKHFLKSTLHPEDGKSPKPRPQSVCPWKTQHITLVFHGLPKSSEEI